MLISIAAAILLAAPVAALAAERAYTVDAARSRLAVEVGKAGLLSGLGHPHTIVAPEVEGRVHFDPERPTAGRVAFEVPAAKLRVADDGIDEEERAEIKESMDTKVLEVASFPKIAFESTSVAPLAGEAGRFLVTGRLKLHGTTRTIAFPVALEAAGDEVRARGSVKLRQTDYGIEPFSAALGTIKVADEVTVTFDIVARAAPPE